jgi:protein phosphatase
LGSAVVNYTAAAATDRGRKRPSNEDAFGYSVEHGVYVVCDGMGGAAAGEIASSLAVDEVMRILTAREHAQSVPVVAEQAVSAANEVIFSRSIRNDNLNGMGTTLVSLVVEECHVWVVNVGDSRCYRLRNQHLEQLSIDHSLVDEQVKAGRLTPAQALHSPLRNVITRALGTQSEVTADIFEFEAEPGDLFMLSSDGLSRELADGEIESLLSAGAPVSSSLSELCVRLIEEAKKAGGNDNITCVLIRVEG